MDITENIDFVCKKVSWAKLPSVSLNLIIE